VSVLRATILALILLIIVRVVVIPVVIIVIVVVVMHMVVMAMVPMAVPPVPLVPMVDTVRSETGSVTKSRASNKAGACRHPQLLLAVPCLEGSVKGGGGGELGPPLGRFSVVTNPLDDWLE